jgi:hypothetical protein
MMSMVEAFCRLNRARGVELLSPDDMMNACSLLEKLNLPLRLRQFESKVSVLQHTSFDDDTCVALTVSTVSLLAHSRNRRRMILMSVKTFMMVVVWSSGGATYFFEP